MTNGLFTVTGVGFIPWRVRDAYRISAIWRLQHIDRRLRKKRGLPDLMDKNDAPDPETDENFVQVSEKSLAVLQCAGLGCELTLRGPRLTGIDGQAAREAQVPAEGVWEESNLVPAPRDGHTPSLFPQLGALDLSSTYLYYVSACRRVRPRLKNEFPQRSSRSGTVSFSVSCAGRCGV